MTTDFLKDLHLRGLIHQSTDRNSLHEWLNQSPRSVYAGFDPTADSLHVGHLVAVVMLQRVAAAGHVPIALVGGATGMIGDPSGRSAERNLLSKDQLAANVAGIRGQIESLLLDRGPKVIVVNNYDWMSGINYLEFLRDVGKHVPLATMLAKDSVKSRLDRPDCGLSFTEFSYMLLQAWDFVHLLDVFDCRVQIGGSDQWGNITAGIDLARRLRSTEVFGLTCPLLTKSDGTKMGKTSSGAIWLDPKRTSPYRFYQYWINLDDADAAVCLRRLTELSIEEIESLDELGIKEPEKRASQRRLAEVLTELVHGSNGFDSAKQATEIFFGGKIGSVDDETLGEIFADVPSKEYSRSVLDGDGLPLIEAIEATGLAASRSVARRAIEQGGIYVNNVRVTEVSHRLSPNDLAGQKTMVLRSGKKSYSLLRFIP